MAEGRGATSGLSPGEQQPADGALDAAELGGERGLGHAELHRGLPYASGVRDGAKCTEVPDLKLHEGEHIRAPYVTPDTSRTHRGS
ncbi:hypothetical protein GCM10010214_30560 [Streptomyces abikoensis]|nr:hypothetical protein GCM10010214_30560 [Streptomyces abikoensis]